MQWHRLPSLSEVLLAVIVLGATAGPALASTPALAAQPASDSEILEPTTDELDFHLRIATCPIPTTASIPSGISYVIAVLERQHQWPVFPYGMRWSESICLSPGPTIPA